MQSLTQGPNCPKKKNEKKIKNSNPLSNMGGYENKKKACIFCFANNMFPLYFKCAVVFMTFFCINAKHALVAFVLNKNHLDLFSECEILTL